MSETVGPVTDRERKADRAAYMREWRAARGARSGQRGPAPTAECGTVSAYKRHQRHGEPTCGACRAAWAEYHRNRWRNLPKASQPQV
jgi:hypothetical protein